MRWARTVTPIRPPGYVERPRLTALLDRLTEPHDTGRVVLVSAPAGQGKTAAVSEWIRSHPETRSFWITLDGADRDEAVWWDTLVSTLGGRRDDLERGAASAFEVLDGLPDPAVLVLDDVHEIVGHPAADALRELLRHPPPTVTTILCSRYDPPLGLERLRIQGRLADVRVADLTFTASEAVRLFDNHGVRLTDDQVTTLVDRTEGWAAALRLAALTLQDLEDTEGFVVDFAGGDRAVSDYLVGEVLGRLDDRQRAVLEVASVCDPLPIELAVELSGCADAAAVLDQLETLTGLVTATDRHRTCFRTHQLLRSHTMVRLRRRDSGRLVGLYQRAYRWYEQHGDHPRALRCAAAAGDTATVELVVRSRAIEMLGRGEFDALAQTEQLLAHAIGDPRVGLVLGLTALERGDLERGAQLVDAAEAELAHHVPLDHQSGNLIVFRRVAAARVALAQGRLRTAIAVGATIDPDAADDVAVRALALATRGTTLLSTDRHRGRLDSEEALAVAEAHRWPYLAVQAQSTLAMASNYAGERDATEGHARAVIARAEAHGWQRSPWILRARYALATADVLAGRPHDALRHIDSAEKARPTGHQHFDAVFSALRGAAEHDTGDPLGGWRRLRQARLHHPAERRERHELAFAALLEQQAALAVGRVREASEVTRATAARLEGSAELALLRAHDQWAAHDPRARVTLAPVLTGDVPALTSLSVVGAPLLDAEIALQRRELSIVHERLTRALGLARRLDALRPLQHASGALRRHLAEHRGGFADLEPTVDRLVADLLAVPARETVDEHLTARERDVLELLPTMRSMTDIAHDLTVSLNTVKTHQRAIYRKLGVDNRRQAVTRARQIGLLVPNGTESTLARRR